MKGDWWSHWGYCGGSPTAFHEPSPSHPIILVSTRGLAVFHMFVYCVLLFMYLCIFCFFSGFSFSFLLQYFDTVSWYLGLLTCKIRLPYILYCVGGDVKPRSVNQLGTQPCYLDSLHAIPGAPWRGLYLYRSLSLQTNVSSACKYARNVCITRG